MTVVQRGRLRSGDLEARCQSFVAAGVIEWGDLHLIEAVAPRFNESDAERLLGLALALRSQRSGHVGCLLSSVRDQVERELADRPETAGEGPPPLDWPRDMAAWETRVLGSSMVGGASDAGLPFTKQVVADGALLMTRRMWCEQVRVAERLKKLCAAVPTMSVEPALVEGWLAKLPADQRSTQGDEAVRLAARSTVSIVTGGPGTGKTYNIQRLLVLLLWAAERANKALKIELAAPTGKAAVRMAEAIAESVSSAEAERRMEPALAQQLRALKPRTIHKLLGLRPDGGSRNNLQTPLVADIIVIDEVSMVDLTLMRRLVEAVPTGARLILMGDPDQLASVDSGTVLADLVRASHSVMLAGRVARLAESKRFKDAPTIATIAQQIQLRTPESLARAARLIADEDSVDGETIEGRVTWGAVVDGRLSLEQKTLLVAPLLAAADVARVATELETGVQTKEEREASDVGYAWLIAHHLAAKRNALRLPEVQRRVLDAFDRYRILAVHRRGPLGVSGLERAMGTVVRKALEDALQPGWPDVEKVGALTKLERVPLPTQGGFWLGQPVLITENAYDVDLRNGDIGIVLPGRHGLVVAFPCVVDGQRKVREVQMARLPAHSGALAMTVHKSQGSQFKRVALVLAGRASPIQTRELIYTGVTRTSSRLDVYGTRVELVEGLARDVGRASGLGELVQFATQIDKETSWQQRSR